MIHQALLVIGAVLQSAGMLAVAPLLKVAIKKMKARLQNRQGPLWRQGYYDLAKLLSKEPVRSETASWISIAGPRVYFAAAVAATTLVPVVIAAAPLEAAGGIQEDMFSIIAKSLKTGVLTEANPFGARASFGFPVIDFSRCTACDKCVRSCPTGAIQSATPAPGWKTLSLSYAACIQCRECVTGCPEQAVSVSNEVEIAAYSRERLAQTALFDIDPATGRNTFSEVEVHHGLSLSESAARLRERIRGRLGRSLHVRQVDAGSCNGCELEIAATTNPLYDLERFGIHLVASPRHAEPNGNQPAPDIQGAVFSGVGAPGQD